MYAPGWMGIAAGAAGATRTLASSTNAGTSRRLMGTGFHSLRWEERALTAFGSLGLLGLLAGFLGRLGLRLEFRPSLRLPCRLGFWLPPRLLLLGLGLRIHLLK